MDIFVFFLYWFWVIIGILSMLFCKFCLVNQNRFSDNYGKKYTLKVWQWILIFIWCFIPIGNWTTWSIIIISAEYNYEIKQSVIDQFRNNFIIKILNKSV